MGNGTENEMESNYGNIVLFLHAAAVDFFFLFKSDAIIENQTTDKALYTR